MSVISVACTATPSLPPVPACTVDDPMEASTALPMLTTAMPAPMPRAPTAAVPAKAVNSMRSVAVTFTLSSATMLTLLPMRATVPDLAASPAASRAEDEAVPAVRASTRSAPEPVIWACWSSVLLTAFSLASWLSAGGGSPSSWSYSRIEELNSPDWPSASPVASFILPPDSGSLDWVPASLPSSFFCCTS